jgi:hypothetical protein
MPDRDPLGSYGGTDFKEEAGARLADVQLWVLALLGGLAA